MSTFERATLHVGLDKTGSTAIQSALDARRTVLRAAGVFFPEGSWHAQLGSCFAVRPRDYIYNQLMNRDDDSRIESEDRAYLARFVEQLRTAAPAKHLVLSYEGFVDLCADSLVRLKDFLLDHAASVAVAAYCRPTLSYAVSTASQRARMGFSPWEEPAVAPLFEIFDKLERVFGRDALEVRRFDRRAFPQGDVVRDFCAYLGLDENVTDAVAPSIGGAPANPSLSREAMLVGEQIVGQIGGRLRRGREFEARFAELLDGIEGANPAIPDRALAAILESSTPQVAYMRDRFGIDLADEAPAAGSDSMTPQTAASLARLFIRWRTPQLIAERRVESDALFVEAAALRGSATVDHRQALAFDVDFVLRKPVDELEAGIHVRNAAGETLYGTNSTLLGQRIIGLAPGRYRETFFAGADLPAGTYTAGFAFTDRGGADPVELSWHDQLVRFEVCVAPGDTQVGATQLNAALAMYLTEPADDSQIVRRPRGMLECLTPLPEMVPGTGYPIDIRIVNGGTQPWCRDPVRPVRLDISWYRADGAPIKALGHRRSDLPAGGVAGESTITCTITVDAPAVPGRYRLGLTLVQEGVGRFDDRESAFAPALLPVTVAENSTP